MAFVSIFEFDGKQRDGGKPTLSLYPYIGRISGSSTFLKNYFMTNEIEVDVSERIFRMKACREWNPNKGDAKKSTQAQALFNALGITKDCGVLRVVMTEKDGWLYSDKIQEFGNERQASDS